MHFNLKVTFSILFLLYISASAKALVACDSNNKCSVTYDNATRFYATRYDSEAAVSVSPVVLSPLLTKTFSIDPGSPPSYNDECQAYSIPYKVTLNFKNARGYKEAECNFEFKMGCLIVDEYGYEHRYLAWWGGSETSPLSIQCSNRKVTATVTGTGMISAKNGTFFTGLIYTFK